MKIHFAADAEEDLLGCVAYIAERNPTAAQRLADRVMLTIERLAAGEFDGPESTLRSGQRVRSWPVPPLRVYYVRSPDVFEVMRIYHHARRPITK